MVISAFLIGLIVSILLLIFQYQYLSLFTESSEVKELVYELTPLLAFCIVVNSIQPALSGVLINHFGCEFEHRIYATTYSGFPLGLVLGYSIDMGVKIETGIFRLKIHRPPATPKFKITSSSATTTDNAHIWLRAFKTVIGFAVIGDL
ncbi:hypothetical protein BUALT_Bualt17G0037800 [Buddleja alternifolia]|uniref:Uncharacterized protein n=1 Tax=Buddleja alternifolia TaxID=168488 RepID=A0AAV6W425_9LAMI|nr:hypothetical protein BUALT_Bualt17G0037800 [Buddleja alternifolia]